MRTGSVTLAGETAAPDAIGIDHQLRMRKNNWVCRFSNADRKMAPRRRGRCWPIGAFGANELARVEKRLGTQRKMGGQGMLRFHGMLHVYHWLPHDEIFQHIQGGFSSGIEATDIV